MESAFFRPFHYFDCGTTNSTKQCADTNRAEKCGGGGFDLLSSNSDKLQYRDVLYPPSMEGLWVCDRIVTQVDGDTFQAKEGWKALGGGNIKNLVLNQAESYPIQFVPSPLVEGGVVNDRGFEVAKRANVSSQSVHWKVEEPDVLVVSDSVKVTVKRRSVELPSDQGFGFNELVRIDDGPFTRAVEIKRRYRRGFDEQGKRIVDGLEIVKTFRVLDGIAGTELPTSTIKSQIRLRRPS